ncbi:hypothetical protein Mapa_004225 [Marchantia paleacea]|nr:hypothetical protein Mapa_004225 [Marchantia paleacea]
MACNPSLQKQQVGLCRAVMLYCRPSEEPAIFICCCIVAVIISGIQCNILGPQRCGVCFNTKPHGCLFRPFVRGIVCFVALESNSRMSRKPTCRICRYPRAHQLEKQCQS